MFNYTQNTKHKENRMRGGTFYATFNIIQKFRVRALGNLRTFRWFFPAGVHSRVHSYPVRAFKLKCCRMPPRADFTFFKLDSSQIFLRFLEDTGADAQSELPVECGLVLHSHSKPWEHILHAPISEDTLSLHRR